MITNPSPINTRSTFIIFFIQKLNYYPKFSKNSLFLETPPKSLLSIPLDSLKREDSRTFFKISFLSLTRPHAPLKGSECEPTRTHALHAPSNASQPADVSCHVSRRRSPLTPRHQFCFCSPNFVFRPIRAFQDSFLGFLTAPDATVSSVLPNSVYIFKYGFIITFSFIENWLLIILWTK